VGISIGGMGNVFGDWQLVWSNDLCIYDSQFVFEGMRTRLYFLHATFFYRVSLRCKEYFRAFF
jgi:hypothetical protein